MIDDIVLLVEVVGHVHVLLVLVLVIALAVLLLVLLLIVVLHLVVARLADGGQLGPLLSDPLQILKI